MEESSAVASLAILLMAALVGGMIAHRLRQPIILGYLVIGAAIGPHALGWVSDRGLVQSVATIGVALLMFTLGLEVSVTQLRQVGRVGLWGGVAQIALTAAAGLLVGLYGFGWTLAQSAVFGMGISLSSTMVCLKILMDRGEVDSAHGRIMVAILILQDISVVVLVLLESMLGASGQSPLWLLALAIGKAVVFVALAIAAGLWVVPWLLGNVGGVRTRELFLLTVVVLCLAAALGTSVLGLSVVFGAFIVGLVLRESRFASQVLAEVTPLRDVFATLFFVSLGMLLDLRFVADHWGLVLITVGAVAAIKIGVVSGVVRLFGYNARIAVFSGFGLFQIGEFSFVLAQTGMNMDIVTEDFYSLIVTSAIITMLLTPLSLAVVSWLHHKTPLSALPLLLNGSAKGADSLPESLQSSDTVLVAGYGRVGQNVARALRDARVPCVVIDIDPEITYKSRCDRVPSIYGDASNMHVLSSLDMKKVKALVVTYPDPLAVSATVQAALKLNPKLRIVARVHRQEDVSRIQRLGAVEVVSPEYEASVELVKRILSAEGWQQNDIAGVIDKLRADPGVCEFGSANGTGR
ncbi:MAG TPA: cation:proton antiporter [Dehalococcoidia bacterium]|nr:cation:proton antiporter [Dehalococcoidia bacterium]